MAATLAGNFTILGSIANLIVVQRAGRHGIEIGFRTYFKVGAPLTAITIVIGVLLPGQVVSYQLSPVACRRQRN
jgi:Na+/H+ antiporter NhaD/arsenite permease-like protein